MAGNELANLKQTIWHERLMVALQKTLIFGNIANRTYEGEARKGGTVKISQIGEVAVNTYTAYSDMTFETLDDAQLSLKIDQQKYIAFQLDETDAWAIPQDVIGAGLERGIYRVRDTIDQFLAGKYTDAGVTFGSSTTPKDVSSGNVIQQLAEFYETMTEANIPLADRWLTAPPWLFTKLTLAGMSEKTPNNDTFKDGFIGGVVGFSRIYQTNNCATITTSTTTMLAGSGNEGLAYAGVMDGVVRMLPDPDRRATNVDALWVYGAKVTRPDKLACLYASEKSG